MADEGNILDNAIAQIEDEALRARIAREVELLRGSRRFGLVFDRHLPESVRLLDHPIRKGVQVGLRDESTDATWRVVGFTDTTRSVAILDGDGGEIPVKDLVVVRGFGEPVFPGLRPVERLPFGETDAPWHTVINGENFHALQALRSTHRRKVDLIYIDPPYNTGNEGWIYNDRYVDAADRAKSSKWLSYMERRLLLARDLLKDTGVIICAIGDDEHHRLRMLMDQVFGDQNFLSNVVWQGNGKNDARFTGGGVDYMVVYARSLEALVVADVRWREPKPGLDRALAAASEAWSESSGDCEVATRLYRSLLRSMRGELEPAVFRYDQIDSDGQPYQSTSLVSPTPRPNLRFPLIHPISQRSVDVPANGWRYSQETMSQLVAEGRVLFGPDETTRPRYKRYLADQIERVALPTFTASRLAGTKRVEIILGDRRFPNPKDVEILMRWIRLVASKDAVVLDFFGGSGTTTEAVLRLNVEDGGTRQSILVTNNEVGARQAKVLRKAGHHPGDEEWEALGVFRYVCQPRVHTVVTGKRPDGSVYSDGLPANVEMFDLTYLDPSTVRRGREFEAIAPLLWLEAGATGERIETEPEDGWALTSQYGVLFDIDALAPFAESVTEQTTKTGVPPRLVFIVTDSLSEYQVAVSRLPVGIETVRLFEDYLSNYTVNTEGGVSR
ncbi:site-specific DNA-methyltransferase [Nocardioides sp. KR10-350]|uniref:site-specific DNA-methyltransferase n=1 Tax=Nocardioides cheoyonin TaxID=3156615 RepID=UPI0032B4546C